MKRGYSLAAIALAAVALAAADSSSAPDRPDKSFAQSAAQLAAAECGQHFGDSDSFIVPKAGGGTRAMEICNGQAQGNRRATARALSDAIDAVRNQDKFYDHPRMPELLALRVMRARTDIDLSIGHDDRKKKLDLLDEEIRTLESDISKVAKAR